MSRGGFRGAGDCDSLGACLARPDIEGQARENLKRLFEEALAKISALSAEVAALRAEIARPKGLKGPPSIKPSGMEQAKSSGGGGKRRRRGAKGVGAAIEDRVVVAEVPPGSRFKGYQTISSKI